MFSKADFTISFRTWLSMRTVAQKRIIMKLMVKNHHQMMDPLMKAT